MMSLGIAAVLILSMVLSSCTHYVNLDAGLLVSTGKPSNVHTRTAIGISSLAPLKPKNCSPLMGTIISGRSLERAFGEFQLSKVGGRVVPYEYSRGGDWILVQPGNIEVEVSIPFLSSPVALRVPGKPNHFYYVTGQMDCRASEWRSRAKLMSNCVSPMPVTVSLWAEEFSGFDKFRGSRIGNTPRQETNTFIPPNFGINSKTPTCPSS